MDALLEFECRPPIGGYDVITIDWTREKGLFIEKEGKVLLQSDAKDELAKRWPTLFREGHDPITLEYWTASVWLDWQRMDSPKRARSKPANELPLRASHARPETHRFLRPLSARTKRFDLFHNQSAFLEFAQTECTEEGIKFFANRYGPLSGPGERDDFRGHRIESWRKSIQEMRRAVELWEKSKKTGDFTEIIRHVGSASHARLVKTEGVAVSVLLKKETEGGSARLCIRPKDLHDALWAQLVLAIDGGQNVSRCEVCHAWFTLKAGSGRSDKRYCSDACRMRAYRKRKTKIQKHSR